MKITRLILVLLAIAEVYGKQATKTTELFTSRTRRPTTETTHRTFTTVVTRRSWTPRPITNFLVLVRHPGKKEYTVGVRVLPSVLLTSKFVEEKRKDEYEIVQYEDDGKETLKDIAGILAPALPDENIVVVKTANWQVTDPQAYFHTIPIATRTDRFDKGDCAIHVIDKKGKSRNFPAFLIKAQGCNVSRICAKLESKSCFKPEGSVLVCKQRLAGIRVDGAECITTPFVFSSVAYYDSWIVNAMKPTGYFDYDMIRFNGAASSEIMYMMIFLCLVYQIGAL